MKRIWKFALRLDDEQIVTMPAGAELLAVQNQGCVTLWALVEPTAPKVGRIIRIIGTGHFIDDLSELAYIGTVQQKMAVWHVFDKGEA